MTTAQKKRRAASRAGGALCAGAKGSHPGLPHPDPLAHAGEGEGRDSAGAAASTSAKPPRKKPGPKPRDPDGPKRMNGKAATDREVLRQRQVRQSDPPALAVPGAERPTEDKA